MAKDYGRSDGTQLDDEIVEKLADEARLGYDLDEIRSRRAAGRPAMKIGFCSGNPFD